MAKQKELSAPEMAAARMFVNDPFVSPSKVAADVNLGLRTIFRLKLKPEFIAYQNQVRAEYNDALGEQTIEGLKKVSYCKADMIERLVEISNMPPMEKGENMNGQCMALKLLMELMGWKGVPIAGTGNAIAEEPGEPDVYQAKWMKSKQ